MASPLPGRVPAGSDTGASAAQRIAQGAIDIRRSLGDRLLATFEATDDELNRLLAGLSPQGPPLLAAALCRRATLSICG